MTNPETAPEPRTDLPAFLTDPAPRKRRSCKGRKSPSPAPEVRSVTVDGREALRIALGGKHGAGRTMLVDPEVWAWVVHAHGAGWLLNPNRKGGSLYVRRGGRALAAAAQQHGEKPVASLARLVAGAGPQEAVLFRSGDTTDLRQANLEVVSKAEARRRRFLPRPE